MKHLAGNVLEGWTGLRSERRWGTGRTESNTELTLMLSCYSRLKGLLNWKGAGLAGDVPVKQIPHASDSPTLPLSLHLSRSLSRTPPPPSPHLLTLTASFFFVLTLSWLVSQM